MSDDAFIIGKAFEALNDHDRNVIKALIEKLKGGGENGTPREVCSKEIVYR